MKQYCIYTLLLAAAFFVSLKLNAQEQKDIAIIRCMDVEKPLSNVSVYSAAGVLLGVSDTAGYVHIPLHTMGKEYAVAILNGYEPDTIREITPFIYLSPLTSTLKETVIRNYSSKRVLESTRDYVVDYDFDGDNILVAAYSGTNGKNAKLFLLDNGGDTLALAHLAEEPLALYKSCTGRFYCIFYDKFYLVNIDSNRITLGKSYDNSYLPLVQQCQVSWDGTLYYKVAERTSFMVTYGFVAVGDSLFHPFLKLYNHNADAGSKEEYAQNHADENKDHGDDNYDDGGGLFTAKGWMKEDGKFKNDILRNMRDKNTWDIMNIPLFNKEDSLLVFDLIHRKIGYYNLVGVHVKDRNIVFPVAKNAPVDIIKDPVTERFYLHSGHRKPTQRLHEIELDNGNLSDKSVAVDKPFAENIKVHNGNVYYLWQNNRDWSTRQLFVQRGFN